MSADFAKLRRLFPALQQTVRGKPVIYFDNACLTIPPKMVVEAICKYYYNYPACHGRSAHHFGKIVTEKYEEARRKIQRLINAKYSDEIIFTRNATESINMIAHSFGLQEGDTILCSDIEHNSNLLPWLRLAKNKRINHRVFKTADCSAVCMENLSLQIDPSVKLISVIHRSSVTGITLPVKDICRKAHKSNIPILIDASQSVPARQMDVQDIDADFLAFSMHKAYGPSGVGVLYGKREYLKELDPCTLGGETVDDSTYQTYTLAAPPQRFEPGLQNYAGVIGSAAAVDFLMNIEKDEISNHYLALNTLATESLDRMSGVSIIGPADPAERGSVLNFKIDDLQSHDVAQILDHAYNIMVRPGKHCVHSWYNANSLDDSVRVSFGIYNTEAEVAIFLECLKLLLKYF